tara:strand:+ start:1082 stop:1252 length:171 start_codon:yes stop_codon:yes gene_type:complete
MEKQGTRAFLLVGNHLRDLATGSDLRAPTMIAKVEARMAENVARFCKKGGACVEKA